MDTIVILAVIVIIISIVVIVITIVTVVTIVVIIIARSVAIDTRWNRAMMHVFHHARTESSTRDDDRPRVCAQESHS